LIENISSYTVLKKRCKMIKKFFTSLLLFSAVAYAENPEENRRYYKSPEEIEEELHHAQRDFEIAQQMFIPWYTGPLITGSANNVPKGHTNVQGYFYTTVNYAQFNSHRKSVNTPNTLILNPLLVLQRGLTDWLDITVIPQATFKWQKSHYGAGFGDLAVQLGFQIQKEKPYRPSVRFVLGETFPTGRYQRLSPSKAGLDSSGGGAYVTSVGVNVSKTLWWFLLHPMVWRFAGNYNIANADVDVHGFNTYGGGFGTKGDVDVGNTLNADLGWEISLTERWVFATDLAYTYSNKSTFGGKAGTTAEGMIASNGAPSSDQLSLAPAIEYNVSDSAGFIGGIWFSVTGRNSANFVSLVLSYTKMF
jgi:hypothetical protein